MTFEFDKQSNARRIEVESYIAVVAALEAIRFVDYRSQIWMSLMSGAGR